MTERQNQRGKPPRASKMKEKQQRTHEVQPSESGTAKSALDRRDLRGHKREPPGVTSAKSVKQIVERLLFLRGLGLPAIPPMLHQNRVLQLARKCSKYQTQPLLKFKAERRHALLVAHLFELSQDLTDQALDQFDKDNYHFTLQPGRSLENLRPLRLSVLNEGEESATS